MSGKILQPVAAGLALLALVALFSSACGKKNESQSQPAKTSSASPKQPQTPFERDLDYVRKGQFAYVFVFTRREGGAFTKDDIAYLKANSPPETNQWISTDEGRRVIAGTNFEFKPEHFDALKQRFNIEDYSGR
jgi:hypothetical protein